MIDRLIPLEILLPAAVLAILLLAGESSCIPAHSKNIILEGKVYYTSYNIYVLDYIISYNFISKRRNLIIKINLFYYIKHNKQQ